MPSLWDRYSNSWSPLYYLLTRTLAVKLMKSVQQGFDAVVGEDNSFIDQYYGKREFYYFKQFVSFLIFICLVFVISLLHFFLYIF